MPTPHRFFTNLGDDQHQILRLSVSDAQYNYVFTVTFVSSANPEAAPTYPTNATSDWNKQADDAYDKVYILLKECTLSDKGLKKLLIGYIEEKYYRVLRNDLISYVNVRTRDLVQHPYTSSGVLFPLSLLTMMSNYDQCTILINLPSCSMRKSATLSLLSHLLTTSSRPNKL